MPYWTGRRVCVTGGAGFLGSYVVEKLKKAGCESVFIPRSRDYDLRKRRAVNKMYGDARPDVVIHLAAIVGGIGPNWQNPGTFIFDNLMMGAQLIDEAKNHKVEKFVTIGTICSYPKLASIPFKEDEIWSGYPDETTAPYGIAKKVLLAQGQAYRKQYGLNSIHLLPVNLYGPRDNFNPATSHVMPALIKKCVDAKREGRNQIVVWGTGNATREFIHAADCARAILLAAEHYDKPEPVNLGTGREIPIRDLVSLIAYHTGFRGEVVWDPTKPDGQPRRCLDTSRAELEFDFRAKISLEEGIKETVSWYLQTL